MIPRRTHASPTTPIIDNGRYLPNLRPSFPMIESSPTTTRTRERSGFSVSLRESSPVSIDRSEFHDSTESSDSFSSPVTSTASTSSPSTPSNHQTSLAGALGIKVPIRFFNFGVDKPFGKGFTKKRNRTSKDIAKLLHGEENLQPPQKSQTPPKPVAASKVLNHISLVDAEGMSNDFYSNLVSWSPQTRLVAIGLGIYPYTWKVNDTWAKPVNLSSYETISCVSCSHSDYLVIGTATGKVSLVSHSTNQVVAEFVCQGYGIQAAVWFKNDKRFMVSDKLGNVLLLEIVEDVCSLRLVHTFAFHKQLVCGISLNLNETQVAFGSNDNTVTVWNISDIQQPKLQYILPHYAAVKAVSFCPWANSLLATGGGIRDRTIRFWHSQSGTLINSFFTGGQITTIHWSISCKELVVTYGFKDHDSTLTVFTYPEMILKKQVIAPDYRISCSTLSPDGTRICVTCNDAAIRVFRLWPCKRLPVPVNIGIFNSELIQWCEGDDRSLGLR